MPLEDTFRTVAADYQKLLIDWIAELRRRGLPVLSLPFALARVTDWLRAHDGGAATVAEFSEATREASRACEEARQALLADRRRRLVAFLRESSQGAALLAAIEAQGLELETAAARLLAELRSEAIPERTTRWH